MKARDYLKKEFKIKDLDKIKFCIGIQVEHLSTGILIYQSTFTKKVLARFRMDKDHPLSTPLVIRSLNVNKDPFRSKEDNEDLLGPEMSYLSASGALIYLTNCIRPRHCFLDQLIGKPDEREAVQSPFWTKPFSPFHPSLHRINPFPNLLGFSSSQFSALR
ncbi:Copia protein-like protein [Drosera capensis]